MIPTISRGSTRGGNRLASKAEDVNGGISFERLCGDPTLRRIMIVISGASGFIGRRLAARLIAERPATELR